MNTWSDTLRELADKLEARPLSRHEMWEVAIKLGNLLRDIAFSCGKREQKEVDELGRTREGVKP